jgi:predicted GNAT family acetyltransferase
MFRADHLSDVHEFLSASNDFRAANPVVTNVISTVALGVAGGRTYDAYHYWVVSDDDRIVGVGLRTAPWNLVLSPMPVEAAVQLGRAVAALDPQVAGINGPRAAVEAAYRGLGADIKNRSGLTDVVYVLGDYSVPRWPAGLARSATAEDVDLLVPWHTQFALDAGVPVRDVEKFVPLRVAAGALWLWEVDGQPRALAGHADVVATDNAVVARLGPVYTPAEHRGQGFGAAITATIIEHLLPTCTTIMLYADAANPASNSVYQRLGFHAIAELIETYVVRDYSPSK